MSNYQWTITADHIGGQTAGPAGPHDATMTSEEISQHTEGVAFRMKGTASSTSKASTWDQTMATCSPRWSTHRPWMASAPAGLSQWVAPPSAARAHA